MNKLFRNQNWFRYPQYSLTNWIWFPLMTSNNDKHIHTIVIQVKHGNKICRTFLRVIEKKSILILPTAKYPDTIINKGMWNEYINLYTGSSTQSIVLRDCILCPQTTKNIEKHFRASKDCTRLFITLLISELIKQELSLFGKKLKVVSLTNKIFI